MASCSSTTVLLPSNEDDGRNEQILLPKNVLWTHSLSELISIATQEGFIAVWRQLPITERLEIAESLMQSLPGDSDAILLTTCITILALFSESDAEMKSSEEALNVRSVLNSSITYLLSAKSPDDVGWQNEVHSFRTLYARRSTSVRTWIPTAVVLTVGIACLLLCPR
jgi:hypothetical protein